MISKYYVCFSQCVDTDMSNDDYLWLTPVSKYRLILWWVHKFEPYDFDYVWFYSIESDVDNYETELDDVIERYHIQHYMDEFSAFQYV